MVSMLITVALVDLRCVLGAFKGFLGADVQWRNFYVIVMDFYWVEEHYGLDYLNCSSFSCIPDVTQYCFYFIRQMLVS